MYSIWLLEYAHVYKQPMGSVLSGQHNQGIRELGFTYVLLKSAERTILIDTGTDGSDEQTKKLHARDDVNNWHSPKDVLAKVGVTPEQVDTVFITHAHYDHMDNLAAFKNAKFYVQEKEILGWVWAMTRPKKFTAPHMALKSQNIYDALKLVEQGRMELIDGEVKEFLPGIDLYPAYDGHTFGSQIILVHTGGKKWAFVGDLAYVRENFTGINNDGVYVPLGLAVGSPYNVTSTLDKIVNLVDGNLNQIIIGHETDNKDLFPSKQGEDGLWLYEIALNEGEQSRI